MKIKKEDLDTMVLACLEQGYGFAETIREIKATFNIPLLAARTEVVTSLRDWQNHGNHAARMMLASIGEFK